jgi:SAM-dependent methyltransferase
MNKTKRVSKDYVFKKDQNGNLYFVGDFDAFYQNDDDPWNQKGDSRDKDYYSFSRSRLINNIKGLVNSNHKQKETMRILEVGCGIGFFLSQLQNEFSGGKNIKLDGMDISHVAIEKAKKIFPGLKFFVDDICSDKIKNDTKYDIIVLNQVLWYILEKLPRAFHNINKLLNSGMYLVVVMGFLREQKYGRETVNGFDGLIRYVLENYFEQYHILKAEFDDSKQYSLDDGSLILKKRVH